MPSLPSRILWFVLLVVGDAAPVRAADKETEAEQIAALVRQLGDRSFTKRQAASKALEEKGIAALPALYRAFTNEDAEVRKRSREVVRAIVSALPATNSIDMKLVAIEDGSFRMGSPLQERNRRGDEEEHKVLITRPFLIGTREVTQKEYEKLMKVNPAGFAPKGADKDKVAGRDTADFPVESVTWFDAVEFCNRLSKEAKLEPYYKLADVKKDGDSITGATVTVAGGSGYRLPTEAEWEYACRAGTATPFYFGAANTGREANIKATMVTGYGAGPAWTELRRPTTVGNYKPNEWGLYDTVGNVAEWCGDWYDKDYDLKAAEDPRGPQKGTHRVIRGGSWIVNEGSCRSASRFFQTPDERKNHVGFRVVRTP